MGRFGGSRSSVPRPDFYCQEDVVGRCGAGVLSPLGMAQHSLARTSTHILRGVLFLSDLCGLCKNKLAGFRELCCILEKNKMSFGGLFPTGLFPETQDSILRTS